MHRCKSSCNRDVCLSAMSERTTGLIMSGKKKVTGMRSSLVGCLPSCRPLPTHLCLFDAEECDHRASAGTTNQSRGNFYAPTTKCGMPLFGHFCSDCAGIAARGGARELNNGRVQGTVVRSLLVRSCDAIIPDISLTLPSPESSLNAASSSANSHPLPSLPSALACSRTMHTQNES